MTKSSETEVQIQGGGMKIENSILGKSIHVLLILSFIVLLAVVLFGPGGRYEL